jgi:DNA-directed RNA polymerase specialized sigma24 family protein
VTRPTDEELLVAAAADTEAFAAFYRRHAPGLLNREVAADLVEARARRRLGLQRPAIDDAALERVLAEAAEPELEAALISLPGERRMAVHAHVIDDRSYEEIAAADGSSTEAVRQRVSRGLASLRRRLAPASGSELDR